MLGWFCVPMHLYTVAYMKKGSVTQDLLLCVYFCFGTSFASPCDIYFPSFELFSDSGKD